MESTSCIDFMSNWYLNGRCKECFFKHERRIYHVQRLRETQRRLGRSFCDFLWQVHCVAFRYRYNLKSIVEFVSGNVAQLMGYNPDDFYLGRVYFRDFVVDHDRQRVLETRMFGVEHREPINIEYRLVTKEGKIRWVRERAQVVDSTTADRPGVYVEGFIQDISSEHEAQATKEYYKDLLQYVIAHSQQGIAVHDLNMNYVYVSQRYIEMYGVRQHDIIGKNHYEVFPDLPEKWKLVHQRVLKVEVLSNDHDMYPRADGHVDYTRWLCRPWFGQDGKIAGMVLYTEIISNHIETEVALEKSRDQLQLVMDNLPIGIALMSFEPYVQFEYMNDRYPSIFGTTKEALEQPDAFWYAIFEDNDHRQAVKSMMMFDIMNRSDNRLVWQDIPIHRQGKVVRYVSIYVTPIPGGKLYISTVVDVTERRTKELEITYRSNHDYLTQLPNRRYFEENLAKFDREENYPLGLMLIDLDGLKLINDAFGHERGDLALKNVAAALRVVVTKNHFIARIGGDEFAMICPHTTSSEMKAIKSRLLAQTSHLMAYELKLSLSIGMEMKTSLQQSMQVVFREAENNMYRNKVLHGASARNDSVIVIFETLQAKYQEERIHSQRVSSFCKMMGELLKLPDDDIKELELAGLMHDIGKITIPDHILDKPGKLNEEEWEIMRNHTINGYNILRSADKYSKLAEYALTHHERFDGTGYPNGLKGHNIPLFSRIISLCDSFEAITANRPYREGVPAAEAIKEIQRCTGTQFDPELAELFVTHIESYLALSTPQ